MAWGGIDSYVVILMRRHEYMIELPERMDMVGRPS